MSNASEHHEALLTLIGMAREEISDAVVGLGEEGSEQFRQLCLNHLENNR